jgi:anaphase-promoting complex subunit 6
LDEKNTLFLISHDMADNYPDEPVTWLSVGVYYLTIGKIAESRRFFSKASMMDPHFGPAWIGFAHTFAAEGEHDQAISAYSTAARLFQGTHLPQLFLGMQHLQLNNITLADEYLNNAFTLCKSDPLLLNELGVVFYHKDHLKEAVQLFTKALDMADEIGSDPKAWIATRANLAHAYRRLERFDLAIDQFSIVKRTGEARDANVYGAVGLCQLQMGRPWEAVVSLHEALAISPQDPIATELLERALEENSSSPHLFRSSVMTALGEIVVQDDEQVDCHVEQRVAAASSASASSSSSSALAVAARNGKQKGRARPPPPRRRLGDVTSNYREATEEMEVSDEDL